MSMDSQSASDRLARLLDELEAQGAAAPSAAEPEKPPGTPTVQDTAAVQGAAAAPGASAPPVSGMSSLLGGLVSDPAVLSSVLPTLLAAFSGNGGGSRQTASSAASGTSQAVSAPSGRPSDTPRSVPLDRHTALLSAVKPYLGERRQATADTVLRLCRLWDALNRAGITPAMLEGGLAGLLGGKPTSPAGAGDAAVSDGQRGG